MQPVYHVLTGPTAAGKTGRLLELASSQPQLVVSADSRQVYRFMNIGTGKPTKTELEMLPHYGIDCLEPGIIYSVYQYLTYAAQGLAAARESGRRAWVCGGTGLYIQAMVAGLDLGGAPRLQLREALAVRIKASSARDVTKALGLELTDPDNPVRVVRQAEHACRDPQKCVAIYKWAGLDPPSETSTAGHEEHALAGARAELAAWRCGGVHVLDPGREMLLDRIQARVEGMFSAGLVEEVAELRRRGYGQAGVVAHGIAYREAGQVLDSELTLAEAIERAVVRTRQYAKRQRTYFRSRGWPVVNDEELTGVLARVRQSSPE